GPEVGEPHRPRAAVRGSPCRPTRPPVNDVARGDRGLDQRPAARDGLHTPTTPRTTAGHVPEGPSEASIYRFVRRQPAASTLPDSTVDHRRQDPEHTTNAEEVGDQVEDANALDDHDATARGGKQLGEP